MFYTSSNFEDSETGAIWWEDFFKNPAKEEGQLLTVIIVSESFLNQHKNISDIIIYECHIVHLHPNAVRAGTKLIYFDLKKINRCVFFLVFLANFLPTSANCFPNVSHFPILQKISSSQKIMQKILHHYTITRFAADPIKLRICEK